MILNYWNIGKLLIEKAGFQDRSSTEFKRYVLQYYCSDLSQYTTTDKKTKQRTISRLLKLNLDRSTGKAGFSLAEELESSSANKIILIRKRDIASNDPNIYGVTNSINYILCFNIWDKLEEVIDKKWIWTSYDKAKEFKAYMESIRDTFFVKLPKGYILNKDRIIASQAEGFPQPMADEPGKDKPNKTDNKTLKKDIENYYKERLSDFYYKQQGFALAIDGKYLHQGEYSTEYIDLLYHRIIEGDRYDKEIKGICHLCSAHGIVGKDTSLRQKFYGSTNQFYFDGAKSNRTYTSFGICKECNLNLAVGMSHAMRQLRYQILGLHCIVIPTTNINTGLIEASELKVIEKVLGDKNPKGDTIDGYIETLKKLSKKSHTFSMLFHGDINPSSQEFVITSFLKDVRYDDLARKTEELRQLCKSSKLYSYGLGLSLRGLRDLILPSEKSHASKKDKKGKKVISDNAKRITNLVSDYVYNKEFKYQDLIRQFIDIWVRINHREKRENKQTLSQELAPYIMTLYLLHLKNFNQLKGVKTMEKEQATTVHLDPEWHKKYLDYFSNHAYLFEEAEESRYYRGLFLIGTLITRIENAEWHKTDKKTFSNRLNLRGISPRKVQSLYGLIEEYLKIRAVKRDEQLLAYCTESLLGIESSGILPQEVVFYILAGKAYESYLCIDYNKNNDNEQPKEQE